MGRESRMAKPAPPSSPPSILWAFLAEHAAIDRYERLGVMGIHSRWAAAFLPSVIPYMVVVAKITVPEGQPIGQVQLQFHILTPSGEQMGFVSERSRIEMSNDFLLIFTHSFAVAEAGAYRFVLRLSDGEPFEFEVPLILVNEAALAVH
jgi:hypothetical protein